MTCIPSAHFSAKTANFSRELLFLMYINSRVHPLFLKEDGFFGTVPLTRLPLKDWEDGVNDNFAVVPGDIDIEQF